MKRAISILGMPKTMAGAARLAPLNSKQWNSANAVPHENRREIPCAAGARGRPARAKTLGVSPANRSLERGIESLRSFRPGSDPGIPLN